MLDSANGTTRVSVGVMIMKDGKALIGKRKGGAGAGDWGFPGGNLEYGEAPHEAAIREALEETGLEITDCELICVADVQLYLPKQFIFIGFKARWVSGEPELREPEKCEGWFWHAPDALPEGGRTIADLMAEGYFKGVQYFPTLR